MEPLAAFACNDCGAVGAFRVRPTTCPFCERPQDVIRIDRRQPTGDRPLAARAHRALTLLEEVHMRLMERPSSTTENMTAGKVQALIVLAEHVRAELEEMGL